MDKLLIEGGQPLHGEVQISGAKNAALPILCASLLTAEPLTVTHVPQLNDTRTMEKLLTQMGVRRSAGAPGEVTLDAGTIDWPLAPYELVKTMRASILALGPPIAQRQAARSTISGSRAETLEAVLEKLREAGATIDVDGDTMRDTRQGPLNAFNLRTPPYPGCPTD
ncbi:MAG: UDP-N-acetylglucosamine 1-carboxyvinyltransferase, partial [Burkholderiales bacterium]